METGFTKGSHKSCELCFFGCHWLMKPGLCGACFIKLPSVNLQALSLNLWQHTTFLCFVLPNLSPYVLLLEGPVHQNSLKLVSEFDHSVSNEYSYFGTLVSTLIPTYKLILRTAPFRLERERERGDSLYKIQTWNNKKFVAGCKIPITIHAKPKKDNNIDVVCQLGHLQKPIYWKKDKYKGARIRNHCSKFSRK